MTAPPDVGGRLIYVTSGRSTIGHLLSRGVAGVEAYDLNDKPLPVINGAPIRCRVERQLGYKQAKYVKAIELVESFAAIRGGKGGYWEDEGYEWYGGI